MSESMKTITLWKSYVKRGAPLNACGCRSGYGLTKQQASKEAMHWNKQAPWEGFKRITISDQESKPKWISKDEEIAWEIIGWIEDIPAEEGLTILELYKQNKFASAVIAYFELWKQAKSLEVEE